MPRNPSALLAVPSKASGAVPNTLVLAVVDMGLAALDIGGVGCWIVTGCFPLDVDAMMVATLESFFASSCLGVSEDFWSVDMEGDGVTLVAVCSRVWRLDSRSCDTSAASPSSLVGKCTA